MAETGKLYREARDRITQIVAGTPDEQLAGSVPACPGWSVKDVVAHLAGVCADILSGNLDGVATDPWTAVQVEARRGWSMTSLLSEWAEAATRCEDMSSAFPETAASMWVSDVTTHEQDIRGALGVRGARDCEGVALAVRWLARDLDQPLRILTDEGDAFGAPDAGVTLRASRFELFRALTGRRSVDQIAAMRWDGAHAPFLPIFSRGPFRPARDGIYE